MPVKEPARESKLITRLHSRREKFKRRNLIYRMAFVIAGLAVTIFGLITLITPGPALLIIPVGLAMLALQFDWAERLLVRVIRYAEQAKQNASGMSGSEKLLTLGFAVVFVIGAAAAAYYLDIPGLPF